MKSLARGVEHELAQMLRGRIRFRCCHDFCDKRMEHMRHRIMGGKLAGYVERNAAVGIHQLPRQMQRQVIGKTPAEIKGCWPCGIHEDAFADIEDILAVAMFKAATALKLHDQKRCSCASRRMSSQPRLIQSRSFETWANSMPQTSMRRAAPTTSSPLSTVCGLKLPHTERRSLDH